MTTTRPPQARQPRPYWHVDAKWITGLLLVVILSAGLLVYAFYQATDRQPATQIVAAAFRVLFQSMPTEYSSDLRLKEEDALRRARQNPNEQIQLIAPATLTVKGSEIAAFTPEELERYLAQRVAEIIYDQGGPGLAAVLPSQSGEMPDLGPITILSPATHQSLGRVAQVLGIIALVLLLPLLFFSASFGRMGSPGCVLSIASFPGAILAFLLTMAPVSSGPIKPAASTTELLGSLLALSLPVAAKAALPGYALPLAVGLALVTLAFLTDRLWRWLRRPRHPEQPLTS